MSWQNKVVLITGGSAGLGRALAEAWAARGARLVLVARGEEALKLLAEVLNQRGAEVLTVCADVTREEEINRAVQRAVEHFGQLDVLVHCAGKSARKAVAETTPAEFEDAWRLNFLAAVLATRAALPHLLASRGHVVLISSLAGKSAARYLGSYPTSKFPLAAYAQQLRLELAEPGLHTLLVCPGPIRRTDSDVRYAAQAAGLPASAARPGGGVKLNGLEPEYVAQRVLRACEKRQAELILPGKARLLLTLATLSPRLGDWLVKKMTGG